MGRQKKDKFEDLDVDFKDEAAAMDEAALRKTIAEVALRQVSLQIMKDLDQDLATKQEIAKEAGAVYREGTKRHKLQIEFMKRCLEDKGKDGGSFEVE